MLSRLASLALIGPAHFALAQDPGPAPAPDNAAPPQNATGEAVSPEAPTPANQPPPPIPRLTGKITSIQLYQGTALITRRIEVPAGQDGAFELVVAELPTATDPASVYADNAEGVEIRSVSCRKRALREEERADNEIAKLRDARDRPGWQQAGLRHQPSRSRQLQGRGGQRPRPRAHPAHPRRV